VKDRFPDAILLSEALTHPKMMKFLAKAGFSQSYTYFTWRNSKWELTTYLRELCHGEMAEYFRPNFFANTPDILPEYLQKGGRNAFKIRLTLASMLSGAYGIYNGFELCENTPIPGREEYINSEKYQYKVWDWDRPGNIKLYIKAMNRIRNENPALRTNGTLEFVESQNDRILAFFKSTPDHSNIVLVVVNLDPYQTQDSFLLVPHHLWGIGADENFTVMDQLSGQTFIWKGGTNYVKLNPHLEPVHVFRVTKWKHYTQESL
jgi:starch synthase (maltosyl-transferring)